MKKLGVLLALVMILSAFSSISAAVQPGKSAVGGYFGYAFGFGDAFEEYDFGVTSIKNKLGFCMGAHVIYGYRPKLAFVGNLDYQTGETDVETPYGYIYGGSDSYDWTSLLANVLYTFSPEKKTTPNVTGGLGLYVDGDTNLGMNFGGGITHQYRKNFSFMFFHIISKC